jgi:hypothetical protein
MSTLFIALYRFLLVYQSLSSYSGNAHFLSRVVFIHGAISPSSIIFGIGIGNPRGAEVFWLLVTSG